jgi:hypothetical protein
VVIERFHPLKREESIAKYSLKQNCLAFERNIAQQKNTDEDQTRLTGSRGEEEDDVGMTAYFKMGTH